MSAEKRQGRLRNIAADKDKDTRMKSEVKSRKKIVEKIKTQGEADADKRKCCDLGKGYFFGIN